jgi:hypothetical protein
VMMAEREEGERENVVGVRDGLRKVPTVGHLGDVVRTTIRWKFPYRARTRAQYIGRKTEISSWAGVKLKPSSY